MFLTMKPCTTRHWLNGLSVRQWPGRPEFNLRSSHIKDSKMILYAPLLNTQHYKARIKGKVEQSGERSNALPYRKGSLRVTLDYGRQLYLLNCVIMLN